ncbi:hypothetical protein ACH5RR_019456 [Cinchona calisaya]|uniref:Protein DETOXIFICATION n=1 Tax=Cinchona calisaya TaxID=153742 RepID=A0ABD2ZPF2_9GENT
MQVVEKLASLSMIVCPLVILSSLVYLKSIISMILLGHLGDTELAGGSLSIGFANITGYSVIKGLAVGMEPICYQAYGAKKWEILTQTYRRTLLLLLLAVLLISLLWLNMEWILLWLGQDRDIISVAKIYITYSIPDLVAQASLHPLKTFLRTQNINRPLAFSATWAMILHFPVSYLLVVYFNLGVRGVALASAWYSISINIWLLIYLFLSKKSLRPWDGATNHTCPQSWQPLLALAGSSVVSVCLEWWWYEIMILLCGLLSNPQANVAAMGILIQITSLLYVFPSSLSSGLSTLVGHELGANQPGFARQTTMIGLIVAVSWGLLAFAFTTAVRDVWGNLYTRDPQILHLTSIALPILGFCELGNSPQTAACGILIGSARPKIGCFINFISFYIIGLPVAALLGFKFRYGFAGFWIGLAAAQISCMCMMVSVLVCTNWTHQASRAQELTQDINGCNNDLETDLLS